MNVEMSVEKQDEDPWIIPLSFFEDGGPIIEERIEKEDIHLWRIQSENADLVDFKNIMVKVNDFISQSKASGRMSDPFIPSELPEEIIYKEKQEES